MCSGVVIRRERAVSVDEDGMVGWSSSCPLQTASQENVCIGRGDQ